MVCEKAKLVGSYSFSQGPWPALGMRLENGNVTPGPMSVRPFLPLQVLLGGSRASHIFLPLDSVTLILGLYSGNSIRRSKDLSITRQSKALLCGIWHLTRPMRNLK